MIEMQRHRQRDQRPDQRAEDEQQDDHRGGQAELELALLKVLLGDLLEVETDGELAGDVHREAVLPIGALDDLDDVLDALLLLRGQDDRKDRGVARPRRRGPHRWGSR